jgi:hypothetical protein
MRNPAPTMADYWLAVLVLTLFCLSVVTYLPTLLL